MRMHADSWVVPCMWQRGGAYGPWPHTEHMDTCWHALRANVVPRALWHHMGPTRCHMGCVTPKGPHVVPQAVWHHMGPQAVWHHVGPIMYHHLDPMWCHRPCGTTWTPCGATRPVAPHEGKAEQAPPPAEAATGRGIQPADQIRAFAESVSIIVKTYIFEKSRTSECKN